MALTAKFPPTERVAAGVSNKDMLKEVCKPMFLVWWVCMWLTASTELAPGTWVDAVLTRNVGLQGIYLLVYVSGLMFVMRHFAGSIAHKWSPVGLMWLSALLAGLGLLALSWANSPVTGILAATVWGVGVCYMWPTMLAVTSERFPKGGALLMGLMGTAGNLSIWLALPAIGRIFDHYKNSAAVAAGTTFDALSKLPADNPQLVSVLKVASSYSFRWVAVLPAVLLLTFGFFFLRDKAAGGYKAVRLTDTEPAPAKEKVEV